MQTASSPNPSSRWVNLLNDPHADDLYRERSKRLDRRPIEATFATGTPAMAGYVTVVPSVTNPFISMNPVTIGGDEVEGGAYTREVSTDTLIFAGVGKKPVAGADALVGFFPNRWANFIRTDPFCDDPKDIKLTIPLCNADASPGEGAWHVVITRDGTIVSEGDTTYDPAVGGSEGAAVYTYPVPKPGTYVVTATKEGFETQTYTRVVACGVAMGVGEKGDATGKVCTCFGYVNPAFTVATPFGEFALAPQQYNPTTGVYSPYDPVAGLSPGNVFGDEWIADVVAGVTGYSACIDTAGQPTVVGNTTSSGQTRLRITFVCSSTPRLHIEMFAGEAVVYSTVVTQFLIWSHWQTDYCPSTTVHCTSGGGTVGCFPTVPDLPLNRYALDVAYSGATPVALPVIASFTVGDSIYPIGLPPLLIPANHLSGIAGTWTVTEDAL